MAFSEMKRVLVTGARGFVGAHLAAGLRARGADVTALSRSAGDGAVACDLLDRAKLDAVLAEGRFDTIFHLAGLNASADTVALYQANVVATATLLQAVRALGRADLRMVLVGSSAEYGDCPDDPITEDSPTRPVGDYGISKLAMTHMGVLEHLRWGGATVMARPFNIVGPGRSHHLLHSDVARKIVAVEQGRAAPLLAMRNLGGYRDFVDVRDVAAGLVAAAERGMPGQVYNLCTDQAVQARTVVETLAAQARVPVTLEVAAQAPNRGDVARQRGSFAKARKALDWAPSIALEKSLLDTLDYWRKAENSAHPGS